MSTILESTNELAKRFGVEGEMTIKDTLDAIVKKLDATYTDSKDIADAVSEFSKNDGPDARLGTKTITVNDTYTALDDDLDGYSSVTVDVPFTFNKIMAYGDTSGSTVIINVESDEVTVNAMTDSGASFSRPIKKLTISGSSPQHTWIFVPTNDFDGIYKGENKLTFTGDTIVPGEGVYKATIDEMGHTQTIQTLFSGARVPFQIL